MLYSKTYPTRSSLGRFYFTAKLYKIKGNGAVEDLPLRPIISKLRQLGELQHTIKSCKLFVKTLKKQKIPSRYEIVSFDIVSPFTNVLPEEAINIIIKRMNDKYEINTNIPKQEMKELLHL